MKQSATRILVVLGLLWVAGCGKSDSSSSESGSDSGQSAPLEAVSNESQLVGTWFAAAEQDLLGAEFGNDGKATLTIGGAMGGGIGSAVTWDYSVLEGGRLRMVVPRGETIIFNCEIAGDRLVLEPETQGMIRLFDKSVFTRLKGQTIAQAYRARQEAVAKKRAELVKSVQDRLGESSLVLKSADPQLNLSRYALELKGSASSWQGVIYSEHNPPLMRQVVASVQLAKGDVPQVVLSLGNVVGPVGEGPRNPMNITLTAEGEGEAMKLHEHGLALMSDPEAHAAILANYESTQHQREQAVTTFADQFKAYCRLEGELVYPNNPNARPQKVNLGLLRVEGKPAFAMADLRNSVNPQPSQFNQPAVVQWEGGKPMLAMPYMQGLLEPAGDGKVVGQINGLKATLTISEILSKDELAQRRSATMDFLNQQLGGGMELYGTAMIDSTRPYPMPLYIKLNSTGQGQLGGSVSILHLGGEYELAGSTAQTLLGATITLKSTKPIKHSGTGLLGRGRDFNLDLLWVDGQPKITGQQVGFQRATVDLSPVSNEKLSAARDRFGKLLESGATFTKVNMGDTNRLFRIELKQDGAKLAGTFSGDPRIAPDGTAVEGELSQANGFVFLNLQTAAGQDARKRPIPSAKFWLWAMEEGGQTSLGGYYIPAGRNPPTPDAVLMRQAEQ